MSIAKRLAPMLFTASALVLSGLGQNSAHAGLFHRKERRVDNRPVARRAYRPVYRPYYPPPTVSYGYGFYFNGAATGPIGYSGMYTSGPGGFAVGSSFATPGFGSSSFFSTSR